MDSKTLQDIIHLQITTDCTQNLICRTKMLGQQNLENFQIVWLDANIDKTGDNLQTIAQLRTIINYLNTFDNICDCYDYIAGVQDEKVFLIVSGSISQNIVPYVYHMPQVQYVYIYCFDIEKHKKWSIDYEIVRGPYTTMNEICEQLSKDAIATSHQFLRMNIISTHIKEKEINKQEASFMYFQLLTEILIEMEHEDDAKTNMINHCRLQYDGNEKNLKHIDEFDKTYSPNDAIWWYTKHCFIYEILNKALRIQDIDILFTYRFFLKDLHSQIKQFHSEFIQSLLRKNNNVGQTKLTVYRGQVVSKADLENIKKNIGGLLSFNSFVSTSVKQNVAYVFAQNRSDVESIFYEINVDYSQETKPCCDITRLSNFNQEEEILFSIGCVFRIESIQNLDNSVWKANLTLTRDDDKDLRLLTDLVRKEICSNVEGWERLGLLLLKMGQPNKAERIYEKLLDKTTIESQKAPYYNQLGRAKRHQGKFQEAITFLQKSLEIYGKTCPPNHPDVAWPYYHIGLAFYNMGEYSKALSFHGKAFEIRKRSLPSNHLDLAKSYSSIGSVYKNLGEYPKALSYYEKALEIQQQSLPLNHPILAASYNSIGLVSRNMRDYSKALSSHEKALEIRQMSLPSNHFELAGSYNNIGNVYKNLNDYLKALSYYEKALEIWQQSLPSIHPSLAMCYDNIGVVYYKRGNYSKAHSFCERAVQIGQQSLPSNHHNLQQWRKNFENAKKKL